MVEFVRALTVGRLIISRKRIVPPTCVGLARNWPVIEINKNIDLSCLRGERGRERERCARGLFAMTDEGVSRARSILEGRENQGERMRNSAIAPDPRLSFTGIELARIPRDLLVKTRAVLIYRAHQVEILTSNESLGTLS